MEVQEFQASLERVGTSHSFAGVYRSSVCTASKQCADVVHSWCIFYRVVQFALISGRIYPINPPPKFFSQNQDQMQNPLSSLFGRR